MTSTAHRTEVDETLRLVLAVARLGEVDLKGWWRSHGVDRSGSFVLRRAFPRSWAAAGLELDLLSATRRHADALSRRSTALHLFSDELPFRHWASAGVVRQLDGTTRAPVAWDHFVGVSSSAAG
ncbi:MAG: BrxE family protein [Acidimicrobiia bacterium]|nr:BrxE family protein [Acidimicrobiia bacterium]